MSGDMAFNLDNASRSTRLSITDSSGHQWASFLAHGCSFDHIQFRQTMMNFVANPNLNSKWLFRADILYDSKDGEPGDVVPCAVEIPSFDIERTLVRRLIPRNPKRDEAMEQTCLIYRGMAPAEAEQTGKHIVRTAVSYVPHPEYVSQLPFYHPKVRGMAHVHEWDSIACKGTISIHFALFEESDRDDTKLQRVAFHLLSLLHKNGHSDAAGFVKRVQHDVVVPQARFQDRYTQLKVKYARNLVQNWSETTDPEKHVFEDLGIAAFLIELWNDMYDRDASFPGFVDIGCGNGLLVHILVEEGYTGWGFDARLRKSWASWSKADLQEKTMLPTWAIDEASFTRQGGSEGKYHNGIFPRGTFVISNHADELTPWTPILAAASDCPFIMIPCCSHDLGGKKYRAPPPKDKSKGKSTYASLVDWVSRISEDCGWVAETEMLRIPSTRNTAIIGRRKKSSTDHIDVASVINKHGGADGFAESAVRLAKGTGKGH